MKTYKQRGNSLSPIYEIVFEDDESVLFKRRGCDERYLYKRGMFDKNYVEYKEPVVLKTTRSIYRRKDTNELFIGIGISGQMNLDSIGEFVGQIELTLTDGKLSVAVVP